MSEQTPTNDAEQASPATDASGAQAPDEQTEYAGPEGYTEPQPDQPAPSDEPVEDTGATPDTAPPEGEHFTTSSTEHTAPDEQPEVPGALESTPDGSEYREDEPEEVDGEVDSRGEATTNDLQAEQYAQASVDPEFAEKMAIKVHDEDKGPAWEYGSLAALTAAEAGQDLPVDGEAVEDTDGPSEEV